jgi:acyl-CoA synthetase (AMP-forming)/AMP-acid ligase II
MIRSLSEKGVGRHFDFVISSTTDLLPFDVEAARQMFSPKAVVDVYACTEAGMFAVRDAMVSSRFTKSPLTSVEVENDEAVLSGPLVSGSILNGVSVPAGRTGDSLSIDGNQVSILSKSKAKVSGFTVFPPVVRRALLAHPSVSDAAVYSEGDTLVAEVSGSWYNEEELVSWLRDRLPFYSVPGKIKKVDYVVGRTSGNERS